MNSDLSGRIVSINADEWTIEDLKKVITKGEALLNIEISDTIKEQIIEESYGNVSVVQEICKRICQFYKISKTLADTFYIGASPAIDQEEYYSNPSRIKISDIVRDLVDQQTGKYQTFLIGLTEGYEAKHEELYKWILLSLLCVEADELYSCLHYRRIKKVISWKHPEGENISSNELTKALKSLNGAQISKKLIPNIIDYDENLLKLSVIDKGFIIWLNYQDKKKLLHMLGFNDCEDIIAQFKELEKSSNS